MLHIYALILMAFVFSVGGVLDSIVVKKYIKDAPKALILNIFFQALLGCLIILFTNVTRRLELVVLFGSRTTFLLSGHRFGS